MRSFFCCISTNKLACPSLIPKKFNASDNFGCLSTEIGGLESLTSKIEPIVRTDARYPSKANDMIGFSIFGIPNGALWGVAAGIASFIPTIGTSIVCIPAIIFLYYTKMNAQALGLLVWTVALVGILVNLITPYLISNNKEISSLFIPRLNMW